MQIVNNEYLSIKSHLHILIYRMSQKERSIFWDVIISVILSKNLYMYTCLIPNRFRDKDISLYSSKIVDKKEIVRIVSNTGVYSDLLGS
jgi:NurA-like 5'-3' nuclease